MALAAKDMAIGEFLHLLGGGLDQFVVAPAQCGAPKPRHAFDIIASGGVEDPHPFATFDDQRTPFRQHLQIGERMQQGIEITGLGIGEGHDGPFKSAGTLAFCTALATFLWQAD